MYHPVVLQYFPLMYGFIGKSLEHAFIPICYSIRLIMINEGFKTEAMISFGLLLLLASVQGRIQVW